MNKKADHQEILNWYNSIKDHKVGKHKLAELIAQNDEISQWVERGFELTFRMKINLYRAALKNKLSDYRWVSNI